MNKIKFNQFVYNYFYPSSEKTDERIINRIKSVALGIFSLGIVPLVLGIYYLFFLKKRVKIIDPESKKLLKHPESNLNSLVIKIQESTQDLPKKIDQAQQPKNENQNNELSEQFSSLIRRSRNAIQNPQQKQEFIVELKKITSNPNFRNQSNDTALNILAKLGAGKEIIQTLAEMGADFNLMCGVGNTPLHWAIANACNETALAIIEVGSQYQIDVNIQSTAFNPSHQPDNTCLHLTIGKGYTDRSQDGRVLTVSNFTLTKALLEKEANPNIQNQDKNTPLHLAYLRREKSVVDLLLQHGADPTILNEKGEKPADMLKKNYEQSSQLLTQTVGVFLLDEQLFNATDLSVF